MTSLNSNDNMVCVGGQWGDEGKGKVVDLLAEKHDFIVRFQGGNNAGHTLNANGQKVVLHLIPSGALHNEKTCVIGNGVVVDPFVIREEIELLKSRGFLNHLNALQISPTCHIITPFHKILDQAREKSQKIGTTLRGIGPAYEAKIARRGIMLYELMSKDLLEPKIKNLGAQTESYLKALNSGLSLTQENIDTALKDLLEVGAFLKCYMTDVQATLHEAIDNKKKILFEGAQGALLDIDHGTYPHVTSSNCVAGHASAGSGVGHKHLGKVLIVAKAYLTRVGAGPFPTELDCAVGEKIRENGGEFGATTGRPRRCGWLDLVALKHAIQVHGADSIALTKLDVLAGFDEIKACVAYRIGDKEVRNFPYDPNELENAEPIYKTYKGFSKFEKLENKDEKSKEDLPQAALDYIADLEKLVGVPCSIISIGPKREESIYC